jgi:hypothetical protein
MEMNRIRLLDFYFLFPGLTKNIRIRNEHKRIRNSASKAGNTYNVGSVASQAKHVFERIEPFQKLALEQLMIIGILQEEK